MNDDSPKTPDNLGLNSFFNNTLFRDFFKQAQEPWSHFATIVEAATKDAAQRTIITSFRGSQQGNAQESSAYKTTLDLVNGNITNEFPNQVPDSADVYWLRHSELVNETLSTRKELILKVIDTVGTTITTIIQPMNLTNIGLAKLADLSK
jgi:hypothetical protein